MRTAVSGDEIDRRVVETLASESVPPSRAQLRWQYVPTSLPDGEVTLTLQIAAQIGGGESSAAAEPRVIDIDVSAVP